MRTEGKTGTSTWRGQLFHLFSVRGRSFLFATRTLELYELDESTARDCKELGRGTSRLDMNTVGNDSQGALLDQLLSGNAPRPSREAGLSAVAVILARDCNLRCSYCYAQQGSYGRARGLMPLDTVDSVVQWLRGRDPKGRPILQPGATISLFGGEPLLNLAGMERLIEGMADQEVHWALTTNATLVDVEIAARLAALDLRVTVSLDCLPEIHDRHRRWPAQGRGSSEETTRGLALLLSALGPERVLVRSTLVEDHFDLGASLTWLYGCGVRRATFSPACPGARYSAVLSELVRQLRSMLVQGPSAFGGIEPWNIGNLGTFIERLDTAETLPDFCSAGRGYLAIGSEGDLFPCHRFTEQVELNLGSVRSGWQPTHEGRTTLVSNARSAVCKNCWIKSLCWGGCRFVNRVRCGVRGGKDSDTCQYFRELAELSLFCWQLRREQSTGEIPSRGLYFSPTTWY